MSIAIELHSAFLQKTHRFFKIVEKKSPYRFVPYLHPVNSNGRCSGTILTGNTCVTVPVIGGGDSRSHIMSKSNIFNMNLFIAGCPCFYAI